MFVTNLTREFLSLWHNVILGYPRLKKVCKECGKFCLFVLAIEICDALEFFFLMMTNVENETETAKVYARYECWQIFANFVYTLNDTRIL